MVDWFSKVAPFTPIKADEDIKAQALIVRKEIWRLDSLPETIICDPDTPFTSKCWMSLIPLLQVRLHVFTAFHPETHVETESVNQTLEEYFFSYCSYQQDD